MSKNWITVASFSQPFEAHLAKTRLEAGFAPQEVDLAAAQAEDRRRRAQAALTGGS